MKEIKTKSFNKLLGSDLNNFTLHPTEKQYDHYFWKVTHWCGTENKYDAIGSKYPFEVEQEIFYLHRRVWKAQERRRLAKKKK